MELSQLKTHQLVQELQDRYEKALHDVEMLAALMGRSKPIIKKQMRTRRKNGTPTVQQTVLQCIECQSKPISAVDVATILGGASIPKDNKDERKKLYNTIAGTVTHLFRNNYLEKKIHNGVYVYTAKKQ